VTGVKKVIKVRKVTSALPESKATKVQAEEMVAMDEMVLTAFK
jgi:hypothetical protein